MAVAQRAEGPVDPDPAQVRNPYSARPNWVYPAIVFAVFSGFVLYATVVVLFENTGRFHSYLSPFFSPELNLRVGGFLVPPSIWVAWAPLAFRLTCYYYRKAYWRAFLWHPRSCAVEEPHRGTYRGETGFWTFNNLHRFALYAIILQTGFLLYDAVIAFAYQGGFHFGLGNLIMVVNLILLGGYTFGCHALRHLAGGSQDCFSCHRTRYRLWKGVTVLNINHEAWAWASMLSVWATDIYIRLLIHGVIPAAGWV